MKIKIYSNGSSDPASGLIKVTARLLDIEYTEVDVSTVSSEAPAQSKKAKGEEKP